MQSAMTPTRLARVAWLGLWALIWGLTAVMPGYAAAQIIVPYLSTVDHYKVVPYVGDSGFV